MTSALRDCAVRRCALLCTLALASGCQQPIDTIRIDRWGLTPEMVDGGRQIIVTPALIAVADLPRWAGQPDAIKWCAPASSTWSEVFKWSKSHRWETLNDEYTAGADGLELLIRFEERGHVVKRIHVSQVDVPTLQKLTQLIDERLPGEYRIGYAEDIAQRKAFKEDYVPLFSTEGDSDK